MKSVLEFCLIGLSAVVLTLLACWGWWELQHWWQVRERRKNPAPRSGWNDEAN